MAAEGKYSVIRACVPSRSLIQSIAAEAVVSEVLRIPRELHKFRPFLFSSRLTSQEKLRPLPRPQQGDPGGSRAAQWNAGEPGEIGTKQNEKIP